MGLTHERSGTKKSTEVGGESRVGGRVHGVMVMVCVDSVWCGVVRARGRGVASLRTAYDKLAHCMLLDDGRC
jgi:hypothetical protein